MGWDGVGLDQKSRAKFQHCFQDLQEFERNNKCPAESSLQIKHRIKIQNIPEDRKSSYFHSSKVQPVRKVM